MEKIPFIPGSIYHLESADYGNIDALVITHFSGALIFITRFGDYELAGDVLKWVRTSIFAGRKPCTLPAIGWLPGAGVTNFHSEQIRLG